MRCWPSLPVLVLLAGCAAPPLPATVASAPAPCRAFVSAWVEHFRSNVARLDGQARSLSDQALADARQGLHSAGISEDACEKPFCVIQPQAGGRLDSYCGYRLPDPSGAELYRWVPWDATAR